MDIKEAAGHLTSRNAGHPEHEAKVRADEEAKASAPATSVDAGAPVGPVVQLPGAEEETLGENNVILGYKNSNDVIVGTDNVALGGADTDEDGDLAEDDDDERS